MPESLIEPSEARELSWSSLGLHGYIKMAMIAALFLYLFNEEISRTVHRWVNDSSWSHGFLIPGFCIYFINQRKKDILSTATKPNYLGLLFLVLCIAFHVLNTVYFKVGYTKSLIIIPAIGSVVLLLCGWNLIKHTWLPILYLGFAVPLPTGIYREITIPMRELAATVATLLLNLVNGMEATSRGVVIDVIYKGIPLDPPLDVAEACSGMRLLMAFLALGVAMAYLHYRPIWQRLVLLASTIPIAIFCNVVRVSVTGFIYILWDSKYAQGIYHDLLGMAMLPLEFSMYGLLGWLVGNLFTEEIEEAPEDIIVRRQS